MNFSLLRKELHALIDALPDRQLANAKELLENLPEPMRRTPADSVPEGLLRRVEDKGLKLKLHGAVGFSSSCDDQHGVATGRWSDGDAIVIENHHVLGECEFVVQERILQEPGRVRYEVQVTGPAVDDEREYVFDLESSTR